MANSTDIDFLPTSYDITSFMLALYLVAGLICSKIFLMHVEQPGLIGVLSAFSNISRLGIHTRSCGEVNKEMTL